MPVTVHIHSNNGQVKEIPDGTEDQSVGNNRQLSHEEFKAALQRIADLSRRFDRPEANPLSDYTISR